MRIYIRYYYPEHKEKIKETQRKYYEKQKENKEKYLTAMATLEELKKRLNE
jgi:hypothetical protein